MEQISSNNLRQASSRLKQQITATQASWTDETSHYFQATYLAPLDQIQQATEYELERLAQLVAQAQQAIRY